MISCNLFLSEFQEMVSCINRVQIANAGVVLYWLWHHPLVLLFEETKSSEEVCKIQFVTGLQSLSNAHPADSVFVMTKLPMGSSGTESELNELRYRYWSSGIRLIFLLERNIIQFRYFSNNTNLVNCN